MCNAHLPGDPTCSKFSMPGGQPSPMMEASLLFKLHSHELIPGVEADRNRFKHVYRSKNGKVRIYKILSVDKKSKEWVKNNRVCDAGGWYCPGQYPPGLQKVLKDKKDFKQLEDFNAKTEGDDEYQQKYFEHLNDPKKAARRAAVKERKEREARGGSPLENMEFSGGGDLTKEQIKEINQVREDNSITSNLFDLIKMGDVETMTAVLNEQPAYAHVRSKDGRGPMWWAHEHGNKPIIKLLKSKGVSEKLRDKDGMTPLDLSDDEF